MSRKRSIRFCSSRESLTTTSKQRSFPTCYGPELVAPGLQNGLVRVGIAPRRISPGSSWENGHNERLNGTLRREILTADWFCPAEQAQTVINTWLRQDNRRRPHQALGTRPPIPETVMKSGPQKRQRGTQWWALQHEAETDEQPAVGQRATAAMARHSHFGDDQLGAAADQIATRIYDVRAPARSDAQNQHDGIGTQEFGSAIRQAWGGACPSCRTPPPTRRFSRGLTPVNSVFAALPTIPPAPVRRSRQPGRRPPRR